jgi:aminopeptidase YwaD
LKNKFILTTLIINFYLCGIHAQNLDVFYQSVVSNISYDSILKNLKNFENYGIKSPGSTAINSTKSWLISQYTRYGYTNIVTDAYTYNSYNLSNIVVTKTGTLYPNTFVIVDGHYDTNPGKGTNDNGSGTSVILEIARVLQNISTEYSVRFIHFSGEEQGFLGSEHYVNDIVGPQNMDIRLVFNVDQVGGVAGMTNNTVRCESDQSSPTTNNATSAAFTDTLVTLTGLYSSLQTTITNAYGSDYMPFQSNNEIITGLYEDNESSYVHTSNDLLTHVDTSYVYEIAKAATGATLYFARAYNTITGNQELNGNTDITLYPNPFHDKVFINTNLQDEIYIISLFDVNGQLILEKGFDSDNSIDLSSVKSSLYFYLISGDEGVTIKSGKIFRY